MKRMLATAGVIAVIGISGAGAAQAAQYPPQSPSTTTNTVTHSSSNRAAHSGDHLAYTGAENTTGALVGAGLLASGAALLVARRRRATSD